MSYKIKMENFKTASNKFAFTLKLNGLDNAILQYLANSLEIKTEENKVELIYLLVQKINQLENKEYKEICLLVDNYINTPKNEGIKNQKENKTVKKEITMNLLNFGMKQIKKKLLKKSKNYYPKTLKKK